MLGWSAEIAPNKWAKIDITLEEEDLRRLVGDAAPTLSTTVAYQLMELESERLLYAKLVQRYGYDPVEGKEIIARLGEQVQAIVGKVRAGG